MASVKVVLGNSALKNGAYPVWIQLGKYSKSKRITINVTSKIEDWDTMAGNVKPSHPEYSSTKAEIAFRYSQALELVLSEEKKNPAISLSDLIIKLKRAINGQSADENFFEFSETVVAQFKKIGNIGNADNYENILNVFKEFSGSLEFSEITLNHLKNYESYLHTRENNKGEKISFYTIKNHFKTISGIFKHAIKRGKFPQERNPFFAFELDRNYKQRAVEKVKLSEAEIDKLRKVEAIPGSKLWKAQKYFLFAYSQIGVRVSDLIKLKKQDIKKRLEYTMKKTGKQMSLPFTDEALEILLLFDIKNKKPDDLIFDIIDPEDLKDEKSFFGARKRAARRINDQLEKLAKAAGVDKHITNHVARHSIADRMDDMDLDPQAISDMMGHSSFTTSKGYMGKKKLRRIDEGFEKLNKKPDSPDNK